MAYSIHCIHVQILTDMVRPLWFAVIAHGAKESPLEDTMRAVGKPRSPKLGSCPVFYSLHVLDDQVIPASRQGDIYIFHLSHGRCD